MNELARRSFWVTNHVGNPILRTVLRSPAGRWLGRSLAVLSYRGRRTGRRHALVVQYVRDGQYVWVLPAHPDDKTWWRNFDELGDIELRLAGNDLRGRAIALRGRDHPDDVLRGLTVYLRGLPRARKRLGLAAQPSVEPDMDLAALATRTVIVRIEPYVLPH